ncbi:Spectrin beta chain, non-erythrocytic 1 [Schistosoma japonicum]|nr:Spectrin beta chain, non-erythrocytic 1 [Schistosoma japonicum]
MKFIEEMNSIEEYFLQLPNEKLTELKQFPYYNLIVYRHQITSSRNKHSALITDTETYINLKMHKLHELFNVLTSSVNTIQCDKYKKQWNKILHTNTLLHEKLHNRENYLKLSHEWLDYLLQLNDQLEKFSSKLKQMKKLTDTNQTNSVDTYLDQFQIDMNQLVIWIDSVQNLLNTLDTTDCQQFNDNQPKFYLQMNIVNSLKSIQLYYSFLEKKLMEISQWNTTVKSVYLLLNEINEELLWIKIHQFDKCEHAERMYSRYLMNNSKLPINYFFGPTTSIHEHSCIIKGFKYNEYNWIVDNEFVENFNKVGMEMHHLQSKSRLLHNELQLRYRIKYFDHPFITLNQTLCNQLQQILIKLNVIDFIQLTIDDIQGMSIVKNAQQFNEIQEYNENEMTDLEKCPLIRIYEEILVTMQNMHEQSNITNVTLTDYYQSNEQVIYFLKIIELIKLLQRHWSKLLNEIKVIHNKLIQHNQYLNVLHNLVQINTKIDEANLRMCETYNSIQSTLMLTDYLDDIIEHNEHKQHEMNSDEEREQLSTVDEQTIVTDLLTEQKSLTVDKEIVINSTLRQMDHIIEQLKLFPLHLKQLRNEVLIFLPSRSVINENDHSVFLQLKTKLNNLCVIKKSITEITFQSVNEQNDIKEDDNSSDHSYEVSVTGPQTIGSSFQDDIVSVYSESSLEDSKEEKEEEQTLDKNHLSGTNTINELLKVEQNDWEMTLINTESTDSVKGLMFSSSKSVIGNADDNLCSKHFTHEYQTPMNSPEAHELNILLLPHVSLIACHLLNRLSFIHMHYTDYLEDSLRQRDTLELKRNVLRLIDNIVSMENWIEEKEKILLTFNPVIYPSMKFIASLSKPCPITITDDIIYATSQLSVQAYRFKTFENELINHANLRLSEIGMLNEGICEHLKKLDKVKDVGILQFIQSTIKFHLSIDYYSDDDDDDDDDEDDEDEEEEDDDNVQKKGDDKDESDEMGEEKQNAKYLFNENKTFYLDTSTNITDNIELNGDNQIKHSKLLEYINRKWQHLKFLLNSRHERFELVAILSKYHTLCHSTNQWIINKRQLLISTDDFGTDLNSIMQLQRRLLGWERDFIALQNEIHYLNVEGDRLLKLLEEEAPKRRDLYLISGELYASKEVNQLRLQLNKEWEILQMELQTRQDKLLASAELQQFFQGLDDNQLWLHNIEMRVATHQQPQSVEEAKAELDLHKELGEQILARKDEYSDLISYGRCITAGETDTHYIQLDQRLDRLENGWSELMQMWTYQQKLLQQDIKIQTFFRDTHSFEVLLSTQESKLMNYQLIKQKNTTDILTSLKSQNEIVQCLMNANESLNNLLHAGNQLISDKVYSTNKVENKLSFIENRYATLLNDARALVDSTKDLIALREDMQKIQTLQEWLTEKKELIEEWDDAGKLVKTNSLIPYKVVISKRCAQHRVLENEIESNSERIKLVFQSVVNTIVQYPRIADQLSESLNSLMMQWEDLHKVMRERGDHMVQLHRAIIFDDGCDKLNCWLNKFFLKFITINSFNQFKQINEEYMEHNSTLIIEQLINELTSIEKLYENIEYSNEILKCLVENKFMNNNNNNWSNESKLVKGCTSMNEVNLYLNKIIEYLNELDAKKKLLVELHVS